MFRTDKKKARGKCNAYAWGVVAPVLLAQALRQSQQHKAQPNARAERIAVRLETGSRPYAGNPPILVLTQSLRPYDSTNPPNIYSGAGRDIPDPRSDRGPHWIFGRSRQS